MSKCNFPWTCALALSLALLCAYENTSIGSRPWHSLRVTVRNPVLNSAEAGYYSQQKMRVLKANSSSDAKYKPMRWNTVSHRNYAQVTNAETKAMCTRMRSACVNEDTANRMGVVAKMRAVRGKWRQLPLNELAQYRGFHYSLDISRALNKRKYLCNDSNERRENISRRIWFPNGCDSLTHERFDLALLPPNVTVLCIGNSYLAQIMESVEAKAFARGETASILGFDDDAIDYELYDANKAQFKAVNNGSASLWELPVLLKNGSESFVHWRLGQPLADAMFRNISVHELRNGARIAVSHNSQMQGLLEADNIQLTLAVAGIGTIRELDAVLVNNGNRINWSLSHFGCNGQLRDFTHESVCRDLNSKTKRNIIDVDAFHQTLLDAGFKGLFLRAPRGRRRVDECNFYYRSLFSTEDLCLSDHSNCEQQTGHQCMPGNPSAVSDVLTHGVWQWYCDANHPL